MLRLLLAVPRYGTTLRALGGVAFPPMVRCMVTRAERTAAQSRVARVSTVEDFHAFFSKLEAGLHGMAEVNTGFTVGREGASTLVIATHRSTLRISGDVKTGFLHYSSPKVGHGGGNLSYKWDQTREQWVHTEDGHYLLELLTRELIHNAPGALKGVPTW